jgi:lysophospholipase L1-like esterase
MHVRTHGVLQTRAAITIETGIMMRKLIKCVFFLGSLLLWLLVIGVTLELWTRWQLRAVGIHNPFVQSRTQGEQWPIPDAQSNTFSAWLLDEELRANYRGKGKSIDPLPPVSPEWEKQHRMALFGDLDEWAQQVFTNLYGMPGQQVASVAAPSEDDLWEVPFFLYKKHVRKKDHVNVLGLTEDFYSNNHGFRDADFPVEKGEDVFRIVCVGASTTEEGPTNDLTYPAILEATLNRHFKTNRFEVINCGISGMNSLKHRMRSADYLALNPDLIIVYNGVNDICHDLFPIWVKDATPWQQRLRKSVFINHFFNEYLLPNAVGMATLIEQNKMADLRFIVEYAAKQNVPVALCSFAAPDMEHLPWEEHNYYDYCTRKEWGGRYVVFRTYLRALGAYTNAIRNLCDKDNLLYIPVAEELRGGAEIFGDICHLRNPGIEKKATFIAGFLIENGIVN